MRPLFLSRASVAVSLEGDHLVIKDHACPEVAPRRVPLVDIERVIVAGQPAISFHALAKLMDHGIPCSFLTSGGRWRGLMDGDSGFHAARRMRQYEKLADQGFCLGFAIRLVSSKIRNSRRTLQRLAANRGESLVGEECWLHLDACAGMLVEAKTIDSVRGIEGVAASNYFRLLGRFFPEEAPFSCRTRRPPRDPANSLLSFAYTLLGGEFTATIRAHGLDVAAGCFHRDRERSPSLALDLMEPFRPCFADRLVLDLLNHHRIDPSDHFETRDDGGVFLNDEGRAIVFRAADEAFSRRSETPVGKLTLRQIIDRQVCRFIDLVENNAAPEFFRAA